MTVDVIELLRRLVAAPSPNPPGDERAVADVIRVEAAALGLPEPVCHALDRTRPNLVYRLGTGSPTLVLGAHMDTVPAGDLEAWESDPWQLTMRDGRLVGLGSADMKGAIAAMLVAASRWLETKPEQGAVTLVLAADEENFSRFGMEHLARAGLLTGDAAVVLEPASIGECSWQSFFVAQRGSCVAWLTAHGQPGHSGALVPPERRAAAAFARALTALLEADLFPAWEHPVDGTPVTVNVATMVEGGIIPVAHPETLRAAIEVRTLEGMTKEVVLDELRRVVDAEGLSDRVTVELAATPWDWFDPGTAATDRRLLAAARAAWSDVLGAPPPASVMTAGTDATHLNAAGIPALPALGPGSLAVCHKPNEFVPADDLGRAVDLFQSLIRHYHSG